MEVEDRDETLLQLEDLLQNTTYRFAGKMEQERIRIETNIDIGIQVEPQVEDFQQQADFVKNVVGNRSKIVKETFPTSNHFFNFNDDGSLN